MSFDGKGMFTSVGLIVVLLAFPPVPAAGQEKSVAAQETSLSRFLDKNGGYRDHNGGYYNPKAEPMWTRRAA
jgi:hypothetical protein